MIRVRLDRVIGWRGQTYSGECEIPEELAAVLGLLPSESAPKESIAPPPQPAPMPQTKPKRKRGEG